MMILTPCLSGAELLSHNYFKNYLLEIKNLVSCPENIYRQLYLSTLLKLAEYCQAMPYSEDEFAEVFGFIGRQLQLAIAALKLRRGVLLPRNAGAEAIAAEEAQWTYAIFSGALLKDIYKIQLDRQVELCDGAGNKIKEWSFLTGPLNEAKLYYHMRFVKNKPAEKIDIFMASLIGKVISFIPERWISENKYLFGQWWDALLHNDSSDNAIELIINKAADKAGIVLSTKKIKASKDTHVDKDTYHTVNNFILDDNNLRGWS